MPAQTNTLMKVRLILITGLLLFHYLTSAQDFSNKGKDFWVIYTGHADGTTSRMALYLTSDVSAAGTVDVNGGSIPFTVVANQITTIQFTQSTTPSNSVVYNNQLEGIGTKKGIHISSNKPIVVYAHILNAARSGSTLVLPTNVLGKEYYASSYDPKDLTSADRSEFAVVATVDNTTVEITPAGPDAAGVHAANMPFQITLSKGDVYQYQSNYDLTGTHIKSIATGNVSCQPIAVFSGSTRSFIGCANAGSGDNLYQQLFPFASWGQLYYTAPFIRRAYDVFRIIVQDTSTTVSVNGTPLSKSSLIRSRFYEFNTQGNNIGNVISADKPVCVFQYMITQGCDGVESDPEMIILNAVDQTLSDITVMSARKDLTPPNTNIDNHYLNIIFKTNTLASLRIDGYAPYATPRPIAGTGYSYIQEDVTGSTDRNPAHHITSDSGFICIAYGTGRIESYGYNAGTNVIDRYQYLTSTNLYAAVNFPATCRNAPFYFSLTLPYQPTSLSWNFYSNPRLTPNAPITNNAPVPDSIFVKDSKTLYLYKLSTIYKYTDTGSFPITVTAQNPTPEGCSGIQEINYDVIVYEKPVVNFTYPANICLGDSTRFSDATNGNGRPVIKWSWSFGNGDIATAKNPTAKYAAAGTYNVKLQTITDIGCIADTTRSVTISTLPVARFTIAQQTCVGKEVVFKNSSTSAIGNVVKWTWNFGDSSALFADTLNGIIKHIYNSSGSYTVTLTVETIAGCTATVMRNLTIHAQPVADFIVPEVCLNDAFAQFTDSSYIADGSAGSFSYLWNFGDGNATPPGNPNSSAIQNPIHKYTATGSYNANLIITSQYGCIDTVSKTFQVNGSYPVAAFTVLDSNQLCTNTLVQIRNNSTVFPGNITKVIVSWDAPSATYTDNNPSPGKLYNHQYFPLPVSKSYMVKLTAYSGQTCLDAVTKTVVVNPSPVVKFSPVPDICFDAPSRQITQATEMTGLTGTGIFSGTGITVSGLFQPATLSVSATSTTFPLVYEYIATDGCRDSDTSAINVHKLTVDAGADIVILEGTDAKLNPMIMADNPTYLWTPATWLTSSAIKNPLSSTRNDITYKLTVTDNYGCKSSDTVALKVLKEPVVPNVFSPNGDGINDAWNIKYLNIYTRAVVEVYNRYGSIVYRSIGYDNPWNGTYKSSPVPVGVYYFIINPGSGRRVMSGWVTLLR